jgi:hypothetical protein
LPARPLWRAATDPAGRWLGPRIGVNDNMAVVHTAAAATDQDEDEEFSMHAGRKRRPDGPRRQFLVGFARRRTRARGRSAADAASWRLLCPRRQALSWPLRTIRTRRNRSPWMLWRQRRPDARGRVRHIRRLDLGAFGIFGMLGAFTHVNAVIGINRATTAGTTATHAKKTTDEWHMFSLHRLS